jgi:HPt (histidine-containing phosphotransfer) domain-containing protein
MVATEGLFDIGHQQRIADQIGPERFQSMLGRLAERIDASIAYAGPLARPPASLPALRAEAHAVLGLAGNFGATSLAASARELEQACATGDQATVDAVLESYLRTAKNTLSALRP